MFKNPNYAWLLDFELPEDPFFGGFYYMNLYHKLFKQGTNEDRYELEKLYNEMKTDAPFPFNLLVALVNFGETYYKTVDMFIYKRKSEHYEDERQRKYEIDQDNYQKNIDDLRKKNSILSYGYDRAEAEKTALAVGAELEANHTEEQNTKERDPENENNIVKYECGHYVKNNVKCLKKEDIVVTDVFTGEKRVIHAVLFDKFKGFYNCAIYCESEKHILTNDVVIHQGWSDSYTDKVAKGNWGSCRFRGIESMYREFIDDFKTMAKFNSFDYISDYGGMTNTLDYQEQKDAYNKMVKKVKADEEKAKKKAELQSLEEKVRKDLGLNPVQKSQPKATSSVDISKINKALGIEDGDDDLNGNIF